MTDGSTSPSIVVAESSRTSGTDDYVLLGAVPGCLSFGEMFNNTSITIKYIATYGQQIESGVALFVPPNILHPTNILSSTSGNAKISWPNNGQRIIVIDNSLTIDKNGRSVILNGLDIVDKTGNTIVTLDDSGEVLAGPLTAGAEFAYSISLKGSATYPSLRAASGAIGLILSPNDNGSNAIFRLTNSLSAAKLEATDEAGSLKDFILNSSTVTLNGSTVTLQTGANNALVVDVDQNVIFNKTISQSYNGSINPNISYQGIASLNSVYNEIAVYGNYPTSSTEFVAIGNQSGASYLYSNTTPLFIQVATGNYIAFDVGFSSNEMGRFDASGLHVSSDSTYAVTISGASSFPNIGASSGAAGLLLNPNVGNDGTLRLTNTSTSVKLDATDASGVSTYHDLVLNGTTLTLMTGGTSAIGIDASQNSIFSGKITELSGTAIPAGGTTGLGHILSSTANFGIFFGSGAPSLSAAKGSLYLRSDGSTTNDRAYINTNGSTTWTALITAA